MTQHSFSLLVDANVAGKTLSPNELAGYVPDLNSYRKLL